MHGELSKVYQNLPASYNCDNCGKEINAPRHCGHPMHLENLDGNIEWVCWMGASCGHKVFEENCGNTSIPINETVNP